MQGFTIVNGTGGVTASGFYIKIGHLVFVNILIAPTGTATIACTGGVSYLQGLPYIPTTTYAGTYILGGETGGGQAVFYNAGAYGDVAPTSWSASNAAIYLTGVYPE